LTLPFPDEVVQIGLKYADHGAIARTRDIAVGQFAAGNQIPHVILGTFEDESNVRDRQQQSGTCKISAVREKPQR
jgi:hypothetical protein